MTEPHDPDTASDHYTAAFEAGCDALITLQLMRASVARSADQIADIERQISRAIRVLRQAIAELRLAHSEQRSILALGFVVETNIGDLDGASDGTQSRPRRTA